MAAKKKVSIKTTRKSLSTMKNSKSPKKNSKIVISKTTKTTSNNARPTYQRMVTETLSTLDPRKGATRAKLVQEIKQNYGVDSKVLNSRLRIAVKTLLDESVITLAKGTGYSDGHFRLAPKGKTGKTEKNLSTGSKTEKNQKKLVERARSRNRSKSTEKTEKRERSSTRKSMNENKKVQSPSKMKKSRSSSQIRSVERRKSSRSPVKSKKVEETQKTGRKPKTTGATTKKMSSKSLSPTKKSSRIKGKSSKK